MQAKQDTNCIGTALVPIFFPSLPWKKGSVSVVYCLVFENETVYFVTGIDCLIHFGDPSIWVM